MLQFSYSHSSGLVSIKDGKAVPNDDFDNLSTQIAKASPVGVKMADYKPTNTAAASCPKVTAGSWEAESDPLPPPANANLCSCMMETLSCVVADKTAEKDFGKIFGFVCGEKDGEYCAGINKNATAGPYGVYGTCSSREQLSFVVNAYAKKNTGSCNFKGQATTQSANPSPTASGCATLLKEAGTDGTGSVAGGALAGSSSNGTKGSGSGSGSGSSGAASSLYSTDNVFGLGLYVVGAVASGMAMILL
jgi:hypothetical protein